MNDKIGLAIITYNRLDYLKKCMQSVIDNSYGGSDLTVISDDYSTDGSSEYIKSLEKTFLIDKALLSDTNKGVAHNKNKAIKYLLEQGCKHIFLIEDDILIKNPKVCQAYIEFAKQHKLQHMNFALHGEMNKGRGFLYHEEQTDGSIDHMIVYPECVGAFSYYTDEVIQVCGYMDENLKNAWEHVWHTLQISEKGYTTPFWFFVDHPASDKLLKEIPGSIENSVIRPSGDWGKYMQEGRAYIIQKYGRFLPERPY